MSEEPCCKVSRIVNKYDLSPGRQEADIDSYLRSRWLGSTEYPETPLRDLVAWFNQSILRTVYAEAGRKTLEPQIETEYNALTGNDDDDRQLVLDDLQANGIDGSQLRTDFISTATLHRHLTTCLEVKKPPANTDSNWEEKKLDYTFQIVEENVQEILQSWENSGVIPNATETEIATRLYLECPICSAQVDIKTARQRGYVCKHLSEPDSDEQ